MSVEMPTEHCAVIFSGMASQSGGLWVKALAPPCLCGAPQGRLTDHGPRALIGITGSLKYKEVHFG